MASLKARNIVGNESEFGELLTRFRPGFELFKPAAREGSCCGNWGIVRCRRRTRVRTTLQRVG